MFHFRLGSIPDGVNTYEVNVGDIWIGTGSYVNKTHIAQADNSDVISASEWKEVRGYDDKWEVDTTLPNVNDYAIGDQILIGGIDIYICVDL